MPRRVTRQILRVGVKAFLGALHFDKTPLKPLTTFTSSLLELCRSFYTLLQFTTWCLKKQIFEQIEIQSKYSV